MKNFSIDEIDNLYRCVVHCRLYKHLVHHAAFRDLCTAVRDIEHDLGEQAQDDYWQELLHELKRFRFTLYAAPIPVNFQSSMLLRFLEGQKRNCQHFYPGSFQKLQNIIDRVSALVAIPDNPLLEKISELLPPGDSSKTALLLKEAYLVPTVEELIGNHPALRHVELVNRYQLRGAQCYQNLFVIGPHYWFPDYIFRAPRSKEVHYIRYSWIPDTWVIRPIFITPTNSQDTPGSNSASLVAGSATRKGANEASEDQEQEKVPEINWHKLSTKVMRSTPDDHTQEVVLARLYLLAGDQAVFLEASEHSKVLALDFETSGEEGDDEEVQQVGRMPVAKLQPGMFLLLRTEGGGDYIVPIANRILGEDAAQLREMQEGWKTRLRGEVELRGLLPVCIDLLELGGSKHVNEINLRYWMSSKCIRPQDNNDFRAILKLVGLQDKEALYRDVADRIERAHRSAGFYIRKLLISQVTGADLHEIHKKGYMEFELPRSDGGSLTAFRIEHISPAITNVSASRTGRPVAAKDY